MKYEFRALVGTNGCGTIIEETIYGTEEEAAEKELLDSFYNDDVWKGCTFEEYRQFHINHWLPARLKDCEKTILRFKNIDFKLV